MNHQRCLSSHYEKKGSNNGDAWRMLDFLTYATNAIIKPLIINHTNSSWVSTLCISAQRIAFLLHNLYEKNKEWFSDLHFSKALHSCLNIWVIWSVSPCILHATSWFLAWAEFGQRRSISGLSKSVPNGGPWECRLTTASSTRSSVSLLSSRFCLWMKISIKIKVRFQNRLQ